MKIEQLLKRSKKNFTFKQLAAWFGVNTGAIGTAVKHLSADLAARIYSTGV